MIIALARFGNYRKKEEKEEKFHILCDRHRLKLPWQGIVNFGFWILD